MMIVSFLLVSVVAFQAGNPWIVYEGKEGPGKGKHVVFVTGEGSYRSEESMPQMARILSRHHGFKCTVLFGARALCLSSRGHGRGRMAGVVDCVRQALARRPGRILALGDPEAGRL